MIKKLFFHIALLGPLICFGSNTAQATPTAYTWAQSYGVGSYDSHGDPSDDPFYGSGTDFSVDIAKMPDGGVVVTGQLMFPKEWAGVYAGPAYGEETLVRYAPDGSIVWQRTLKQTNDTTDSSGYYHPTPTRIYQILTDAVGNIFICGGKANPNNGGQAPFVAKLSADGSLLWQNGIGTVVATFGDPLQDYPCGPSGPFLRMAVTADGGVLVGGDQARPGIGYSIPVLEKFNGDGSLGLYKAFDSPAQYTEGFVVAQSKDGTKYAMITSIPYDGGYGWHFAAMVTDTSGAVLAQRAIIPGTTRNEFQRAMVATNDGGFATLSKFGDGSLILRKFNSDFSVEEFEKIIAANWNYALVGVSSLKETSDGGFLIGGYTSALGEGAGGGNNEAMLMKVAADGTLSFVSLLGGPGEEGYADGITIGCNAVEMADGGYAFTITTRTYAIDFSARKTDWWTVRTDSNRRVANFGDLMLDQALTHYTVTDTTTTPTVATDLTPVTYSLAVTTTTSPTFNIDDVGTFTGINKPTIAFQAAAHAIVPPAPAITFSTTAPTTAGDPMHFSATAPSGWNVRVQSSATPNDEPSWSDLDDSNGGAMSENPGGHYTLDSAAYPSGPALYFRAIAALSGETDLISEPAGPFALDHAALRIAATATSTSDPVNGHFAHTGDDIVYTLTFTNTSGVTASNLHVATTVPTYIETQTNLTKQFVVGDVLISPGGVFIPESSPGANDAQIVWDVGNLAGNLHNFVRFTLHAIAAKVRPEQGLVLPNNYAVYSSSNQPGGRVTGYESGAENIETHMEGPIKLTVSALTGTVAPGQSFTYHLSLTNLGATTAAHAVAAIGQPNFTRYLGTTFSNTPPPTKKKPKKGVPPPFVPTAKLVYVAGQTEPQVVMDVGPLLANQTVTMDVTFQAQWANPSDVPKLSTTDYVASFLTDAGYASFLNNLSVAAAVPDFGGTIDFVAFSTNPTNLIAFSKDDSGQIDVILQGSVTDAPELGLFKTINSTPLLVVGDGDGNSATMVQPGGQLTCWMAVGNSGKSDAVDVYVQDRMPDHSTYVANSAQVIAVVDGAVTAAPPPGKKKKKHPPVVPTPDTGTLRAIQDPDHHHLRFAGLKLPKQVQLMLQYTVKVDNGGNAPAAGTLINADDPINAQDPSAPRSSVSSVGSASTPHTSVGLYAGNSIIVTGQVAFNSPTALPLVAKPGVSHDVNATANALNSIYQTNASALPLTNPRDPASFVPGAQRYYFRYQNMGSVLASNVALTVPVPEHTAFYRASFVNVPADSSLGKPGEVIATPATSTITTPAFLSTGGTVTFTWQQLPATVGGYVMVEFIVTSDVIQQTGSLVGGVHPPDVVLQDNVTMTLQPRLAAPLADAGLIVENRPHLNGFQDFLSPHKSVAKLTVTPADDPLQIPQLGYSLAVPGEVLPGQTFDVQLTVMNTGEIGTFPIIQFAVPDGTTFVSANAGQGTVITPDQSEDGFLTVSVANNNGPTPNNSGVAWMPPHSMGVITVQLKATGAGGSDIIYSNISDYLFYLGRIYAPKTKTHIVGDKITASPALSIAVSGPPVTQVFMYTLTGTVAQPVNLFNIGGGNIVAQGAGNIVAQGGGNIVAQGAGNIVAQGGGNILTVGASTAGFLVEHGSEIVAAGAGNILVPPGASIVAQGAGNIVAAGAGNIVAQGAGNIVAQGAGNIVAQGGGNFAPPSPAIASLFGTGAGQIVAQGGGNIVAQGAGNIVAQGAGNIMAAGGGGIISLNGGGIHSSTPDSMAMIKAPGGQIISTDGNSIVAQGGGN